MLFHSVTEEDVVRRNCLAKSCTYCVRNSLLEDQNHSILLYRDITNYYVDIIIKFKLLWVFVISLILVLFVSNY